ncbi:MAG: hypothetical protein J1F16_08330 [Muribaculaceae bacterium]|nr:hypothetical protein [Muribaculaceae bacterium]
MYSANIKRFLFFNIVTVLLLATVACNKKAEEDENEIAVTPAMVAVKNFYIQPNDKVMAHLDSVFFSIDLKTGVIFNADSLPKGTDVKKLVPSITFANTMTKAELVFINEDNETVTTNYLTTPTDSIDFTQPVKLSVVAQDAVNSFEYLIKVNVHTQDPDELVWSELATSDLPARYPNPVAQKTIARDNTVYSLIEEYNGEYTLAISSDIYQGTWQTSIFNGVTNPKVSTLTSTDDQFYILDTDGNLYMSSDFESWNPAGVTWINILGQYGSSILGIKEENGIFLHTRFPQTTNTQEKEVSSDFPIYYSSSLAQIDTEWADNPMAFLACGLTESGYYSSAIWGYDGNNWVTLDENTLPGLKSPMLARYVVYRNTNYLFTEREFDVWLILGGVKDNGEMNRDVYISYNNGVTWVLAPESMQLTETVPSLEDADVIVAGYRLSADLADAWTMIENTKTRASYTIEGTTVSWICPYLYIFGGYENEMENHLNTSIYRGVLERLKFIPNI